MSDFNQSDTFVYLYMFGGDHIQTSGGFEEWTAATRVAAIPEPNFMLFIALSCAGFTLFRRRLRF
jgi:hypothetical protein